MRARLAEVARGGPPFRTRDSIHAETGEMKKAAVPHATGFRPRLPAQIATELVRTSQMIQNSTLPIIDRRPHSGYRR